MKYVLNHREVLFGEDARSKILNGAFTLAKAVKSTLGPRGLNVIIGKGPNESPHITKDGVTVAKNIVLEDPVEDLGARIVREAAMKTADSAGDGTTTATVLTEALLREGVKQISIGHAPINIKRGMEAAMTFVAKEIEKLAIPIEDNEQIKQIATISANGDEEIGNNIADAMAQVGNDGIITLEEDNTGATKSSVYITNGFEFDRGYGDVFPFVNDPKKARIVFDNALVWVINTEVSGSSASEDIIPIMKMCNQEGIPLVIIAKELRGDPLALLIQNVTKGLIQAAYIKAPGYGDGITDNLSDIATLTGATLRDEARAGDLALKNVDVSELGMVSRIEIYKEKTILVRNETPDISAALEKRVEELRAQIKAADDSTTKKRVETRLARLVGGVAVYKVAAPTEQELKEKRDRVEDALCATRAAIAEGIVPGGGTAYLKIYKKLTKFKTKNQQEQAGVNIVANALLAPFTQIVKNAGLTPELLLPKVLNNSKFEFGYNAATETFGNLVESGVIDPAKVSRVALENAVSVAGVLLTSDCTMVPNVTKILN